MCETNPRSHCRLGERDRRADRPHEEASRKAIRRVRRQIAFDFLSRELSRQWAYADDDSASLSPPENQRHPLPRLFSTPSPPPSSSASVQASSRRRACRAQDRATANSVGRSATHRGILITGSWRAAGLRPPSSRRSCRPRESRPVDNECSSMIVDRDAS